MIFQVGFGVALGAILLLSGTARAQRAGDVPEIDLIALLPKIQIVDDSPFWDASAESWRFSATISLLNLPVIAEPRVEPDPVKDERPRVRPGVIERPTDDLSKPPELPFPIRPGGVIAPPERADATARPIIERVEVRYARHVFPGDAAHQAAAFTIGAPTGQNDVTNPPFEPPPIGDPIIGGAEDTTERETRSWYITEQFLGLPALRTIDTARRGDTLFYEWVVTYRDRNGQSHTVTSARQRKVIDCRPADTTRDLMRLQQRALVYERELGGEGSVGPRRAAQRPRAWRSAA
jgi:hypothetical protein